VHLYNKNCLHIHHYVCILLYVAAVSSILQDCPKRDKKPNKYNATKKMRPKPVSYSLLGSPVNTKQRTRHSDSSPSFSGTWKNNFVFPASGCQLPTC